VALYPRLCACTTIPREIRTEEEQPQPSDAVAIGLCESPACPEMFKYLLLLQDDGGLGLMNSPFFTCFCAFYVADIMSASLKILVLKSRCSYVNRAVLLPISKASKLSQSLGHCQQRSRGKKEDKKKASNKPTQESASGAICNRCTGRFVIAFLSLSAGAHAGSAPPSSSTAGIPGSQLWPPPQHTEHFPLMKC